MRIHLRKGQGGPDTLTCHRPDGSTYATWLKPHSVYHDLAHYVVERRLHIADGFWGLLAQGQTLESYDLPNHERPFQISPDGYRAEFLATLIQSAVPTGSISPAYIEMLQQASAAQGLPFPEMPSEEIVQEMIAEAQALTRRWEGVEEELVLEF
jgi:hypothetical protein